jgi:hypothetical protein
VLIETQCLVLVPKGYFETGPAFENGRFERNGLYLVAVEPHAKLAHRFTVGSGGGLANADDTGGRDRHVSAFYLTASLA